MKVPFSSLPFSSPNGHHMLPPEIKFAQMLPWFDRHLGMPTKTNAAR